MQCKFVKENNDPCAANAVNGSDYCFSHDPTLVNEKLLAVTKGGFNRRYFGIYGEERKIEKAKDIKQLIAETINGILTGKIPSNNPATAIGFLSRCWLDANEQSKEEVFDFPRQSGDS